MRKQNLEQPTGGAFLSQRDLLSQDRHRASLCTLGRVGHLRCTLSVTSLITCSPHSGAHSALPPPNRPRHQDGRSSARTSNSVMSWFKIRPRVMHRISPHDRPTAIVHAVVRKEVPHAVPRSELRRDVRDTDRRQYRMPPYRRRPIERFRATSNLAEGCHMGNPGVEGFIFSCVPGKGIDAFFRTWWGFFASHQRCNGRAMNLPRPALRPPFPAQRSGET